MHRCISDGIGYPSSPAQMLNLRTTSVLRYRHRKAAIFHGNGPFFRNHPALSPVGSRILSLALLGVFVATELCQPARLSLTHAIGRLRIRDNVAPLCRPHHFFPRISSSAVFSSSASANSRFYFAFSSSSLHRRFASETSMPPYFDCQR